MTVINKINNLLTINYINIDIDFIILGEEEENFNSLLLLQKNKQNASVYRYKENPNNLDIQNIDGTIFRIYWTPFLKGYAVLYRNILNELKFSNNYKVGNENLMDYKISSDRSFQLEYTDREIDLCWKVSIFYNFTISFYI